MSTRSTRCIAVGALVLVLGPVTLALPAAPQESKPASKPSVSPEERVQNYATALRAVFRVGGTVTPVLDAQAKNENATTGSLVKWIGQTIKERAAAEGVDTAPTAVEPVAKRLVEAASELLKLRDKVLPPLASAVADPANEDVKPFLAKAEARIYIALCSAAIRFFLGPNQQASGTYDGMFANLEKLDRDKAADAFMEIFSSTAGSRGQRELAGEGVAQLGSKRHLETLRTLLADSNPAHDPIRQKVVFTLARLGDRTLVDKALADYDKKLAETKKPDMTPLETAKWADNMYQSAILTQNIHDNEPAIKHYEAYLVAIAPVAEKLGPQIAGRFQNVFYNLACLYSLKSDVETGFSYFEKALGAGYNNLKWANTDGDLTNLRKDPRFKQMIEKAESGKGAADSPASRPPQ